MITVAKTRIVSPDFVVLLESVGEILKIEKKKTRQRRRKEHKPTSAFLLRILIDDVHHHYRFTAVQ